MQNGPGGDVTGLPETLVVTTYKLQSTNTGYMVIYMEEFKRSVLFTLQYTLRICSHTHTTYIQ